MNAIEAEVSSNDSVLENASEASEDAIKAAFNRYKNGVRHASILVGCWLIIVLMPAGALLDYFVYPEKLGRFMLLRLICAALGLGLWFLVKSPFGFRHHRKLAMVVFALPNLFMSLMIYLTDGAHSPYYAGLNIMLMGFSWVAQMDLTEALVAATMTIIMYCAACILHGGCNSADYFNSLYFIALTSITAATGGVLLNRLRFREYALRLELDGNRKKLLKTNAKLVELDRAKTAFFANVSHELRTPLTLLIGPLERLRHQSPSSRDREKMELLDIMYNNAMRLLRLINDLLDLVRLDSGAIRIVRSKQEVHSFLDGIAKSVAHIAEQRNLQFTINVDAPRDASVFIDRDKLEKIILNLLFNAFKFTPEGGAVALKAEMAGQNLAIIVSDTGKGIAESDLPRIFDRFWQVESASTRNYQGVGIGLALVKELSEAHGGSVSVESKVDKGTTFRVTVDASEPEKTEAEEETKAIEAKPIQTEWLSQLYRRAELFPAHVITNNQTDIIPENPMDGKPLILVADDEPDMRRFLVSQLSDFYYVHEARNGSEALKSAEEHDFALILLDFMMPGIDGITLTGYLRENTRTATVPIVILTARADEGSKLQALEAGVTDFLTKPFASSELVARCRNLILQGELQKNLLRKTEELEAALEQIKNTEAQLVHQAKMASLGQLSSGLMHEINNPLNFANTASHLLLKRLQKIPEQEREPLLPPLKDLQDGIRRVAEIIGSLRSFVHPDTSNFETLCLRQVIDESARFVQIPPTEISVEINVPEDLKVWGNRNQLIHLLINMLQNSVDSLREKGAAEKKIKMDASLQNGRVVLKCEDNGKGIKPTNQDKVFDAFFTTKPVGSGMGLGLNICYRIVKNHFGEITLESQENEFCRFIITLNQTRPTA